MDELETTASEDTTAADEVVGGASDWSVMDDDIDDSEGSGLRTGILPSDPEAVAEEAADEGSNLREVEAIEAGEPETSEDDLLIAAAATAAGIPADQLPAFKEMVNAERAKIAEAQAEADAQAQTEALQQELAPYAQQLLSRTQIDPSDPNYLPPAMAEELWSARWETEQAQSKIAEYEAKFAASERESQIGRIVAEFPDADELVVRSLIEAGRPASEVQGIAQRITDKVKNAAKVEVSRHVAQATATRKTTATPAAGLPSSAGNRSPKSLGEAME